METRFKKSLVAAFAILCLSLPVAHAEYVTNKKTVEKAVTEGSSFLERAITAGIGKALEKLKDKLPSIIKDIAKAILDVYAAQLSGILFGSDSSLDAAVTKLIDEIQESERILGEQISEVLDELQDQTEADLQAGFSTPMRNIEIWLLDDDLDQRFEARETIRSAAERLGQTQDTIKEYILLEAESSESQVRRLQLLTLHLSAMQMEAVAWKYYYGIIALEDAFRDAGFDDMSRFSVWVSALSEREQQEILSSNVRLAGIDNEVFEGTFEFYDAISSQNYFDSYISERTSPIVFQESQYVGAIERYEDTRTFQSTDSWNGPSYPGLTFTSPTTSISRLDGLRWYYYIDVPNVDCLANEDPKWDTLDTNVTPWRENTEDASYSECNRFWFVSPSLVRAPGPPATYVASFDQYGSWFDDPQRAVVIHQKLMVGDLITDLYGPLSLILDGIHLQVRGDVRRANNWDRKLDDYQASVASLAAVGTTYDYISYQSLSETSLKLRQFGAGFDFYGSEEWVEILKYYLNEFEAVDSIIDLVTRVFYERNWISPAHDPSQQQAVPISFVELALGTGGFAERLIAGESLASIEMELIRIVEEYASSLEM